jgi:hypothetical protein
MGVPVLNGNSLSKGANFSIQGLRSPTIDLLKAICLLSLYRKMKKHPIDGSIIGAGCGRTGKASMKAPGLQPVFTSVDGMVQFDPPSLAPIGNQPGLTTPA